MGRQYARAPSPTSTRTVEISRHEMPRQGFEVDLFDRVPDAPHLPVDDRLQGCSGWIGQETGRHLNLAAQLGRSKLPPLKIRYLLEGEVEIEMAQLAQPDISRSRWCLRTCPGSAITCRGLLRQAPGDEKKGPEKTLSRSRQSHWEYSSP